MSQREALRALRAADPYAAEAAAAVSPIDLGTPPAPAPGRPRGATAAVTAAAVGLLGLGATGWAVTRHHEHGVEGASTPRSRAQQVVDDLGARLVLPAGTGRPDDAERAAVAALIGLPADSYRVTSVATVRTSLDAVAALDRVATELPSGTHVSGSSRQSGSAATERTYGLPTGRDADQLTVDVAAVPAPGGATVAVQVAGYWNPARTAAEAVASTGIATLRLGDAAPVVLTASQRRAVADLLGALPTTRPSPRECGSAAAAPDVLVVTGPPLQRFTVGVDGCGLVAVTVDGADQPTLVGGPSFDAELRGALGSG